MDGGILDPIEVRGQGQREGSGEVGRGRAGEGYTSCVCVCPCMCVYVCVFPRARVSVCFCSKPSDHSRESPAQPFGRGGLLHTCVCGCMCTCMLMLVIFSHRTRYSPARGHEGGLLHVLCACTRACVGVYGYRLKADAIAMLIPGRDKERKEKPSLAGPQGHIASPQVLRLWSLP